MVETGATSLGADEGSWEDPVLREKLLKLEAMENVTNAFNKMKTMGIDFTPPNDFVAKKIKTISAVNRITEFRERKESDMKKKVEKQKQNILKKFGKKIQN